MANTPTAEAELGFKAAQHSFMGANMANKGSDTEQMAWGLAQLATALGHLAIGVRATYIKLEQVEALIKNPGRPPKDLRSWLE
jgi:hypothetical protein